MPSYALWLLFFSSVVGFVQFLPGNMRNPNSLLHPAHAPVIPPVTVYDPDPGHLWNRLYQALLVGGAGEGAEDPLQLDPFVSRKRNGQAGDQAHGAEQRKTIAVILDEFTTRHGERLVRDPRKRAMLQRDLWAWFDALELSRSLLPPKDRSDDLELARRVATILPRLALTAAEIEALPDNFAEAVNAKKFPDWLEASRLREGAGPWVLLGTEEKTPLARTHEVFFGSRSAFLVYLRDPQGREATLKHLAAMQPGGKTPRIEQGAYYALARRMQVIDERGLIRATAVVEAVEIRGLGNHVWKLNRKEFLAGKPSLLPLGEQDTERSAIALLGRNAAEGKARVLESCGSCHTPYTLESHARFFGPNPAVRPGVIASDQETEISHQRHRKMASYEWGLLQGLGRSPPGE